jgi:hypothetical protein
MGQAIPVRKDYTASEVRRLAKRAQDAAQARRLLAIAAVLDGDSQEDAIKIGGMDRKAVTMRALASGNGSGILGNTTSWRALSAFTSC